MYFIILDVSDIFLSLIVTFNEVTSSKRINCPLIMCKEIKDLSERIKNTIEHEKL